MPLLIRSIAHTVEAVLQDIATMEDLILSVDMEEDSTLSVDTVEDLILTTHVQFLLMDSIMLATILLITSM